MSRPPSAPSVAPPRLVSVGELLEQPEVAPMGRLVAGEHGLERPLSHPRIQKNGLVLVGHLTGLVPTRVQILGETEVSFLETLAAEERQTRMELFFGQQLSLVVVTRGAEPPREMVECARRTQTPLLVVGHRSSRAINLLHAALDRLLAPQGMLHGVLVEIHGLGMLLLGPSGIGKSECALFLVERGHRLIADDRVRLALYPPHRVLGRPEPLLRHHLEVRGIGILNVRDLFGATAVRDEAEIHLVVELCPWDDEEDSYERLGLSDLAYDLFDLRLPLLRIPVRPGRDMAVILEVAARNELLKRAGHHSARTFARKLAEALGVSEPPSEG